MKLELPLMLSAPTWVIAPAVTVRLPMDEAANCRGLLEFKVNEPLPLTAKL